MITEWKRVSDGQMIACLLCGLAFINKHAWTLELGHVSLRIHFNMRLGFSHDHCINTRYIRPNYRIAYSFRGYFLIRRYYMFHRVISWCSRFEISKF